MTRCDKTFPRRLFRAAFAAPTRQRCVCPPVHAFFQFQQIDWQSTTNAASGAHEGHETHRTTRFDRSATREFKAVQKRMMRNMAMPFTGDPDVDFRMHVIPHHQAAMDMAWVALRHAEDPWTRQAAQAILIAQQQEISQFQGWLARHRDKAPRGGQPRYIQNASTYPDPEQDIRQPGSRYELVGEAWAPTSGVPLQQELSGQSAGSATREFKAAGARMMRRSMAVPFTGDADVEFRTNMIPHHQGAIDMARVALRHAKNAWTRQAAQAIITAQQHEIYQFRAWLAQHRTRIPSGG